MAEQYLAEKDDGNHFDLTHWTLLCVQTWRRQLLD